MSDPDDRMALDATEALGEESDPNSENEDDLIGIAHQTQAVVTDTDWTTETLLNQMRRGNIDLNPAFQRRDAWTLVRKSRFIESLVLDLPVPQIVLAERREQRGTYIVIDGKQRLLALAQFAGQGDSANAGFRLRGLVVRDDLNRRSHADLEAPQFREELTQFENSTIRTVIIRGWPDEEFLYLVFLRLNTGSVSLSPQELRQALHPGPFVSFVDEFSFTSEAVRDALGIARPDFRMRDAELVTRFYAFSLFLPEYAGDLRRFLDSTCLRLNDRWEEDEVAIRAHARSLEAAIETTRVIFGRNAFRRALGRGFYETRFNRAIFDIMTYHFREDEIAREAVQNAEAVREAFERLSESSRFSEATAATTKSIEATYARLSSWTQALSGAIGVPIGTMRLENNRIRFLRA